MLLVVGALLVGHAFAACQESSEHQDQSVLLQVTTFAVKSHDKLVVTEAKAAAAPHPLELVHKEAPTFANGPPEPDVKVDMVDRADGAYAVQHGTHAPANVKMRSTTDAVVVCTSVLVTMVVGWLLFWRLTKSGIGMHPLRLNLLCWCFGACSLAMNVLNKVLVNDLKSPMLLTTAQMFMTLLAILICVRHRLTGTTTQCVKWCVVPVLFCGMLLSSFYTFEYLTLSLLMIIRNVGPLVTLPIECCIMSPDKRPYVTKKMVIALLVILASTFLYIQEIVVSSKGILFAISNMLLAIVDRVAQRRLLTTECKDLSLETCMLLNNSVGIVPVLALAIFFGELSNFRAIVMFGDFPMVVLFILYGIVGTGICYFALAVQREISATSFMVVQNAVRMAVVLFGVFCFLDPIGWPYQVMGLVFSFVGTFAYGLAQLQALAELKATKAAQEQVVESNKGGAEALLDESEPFKT